MICSPKTKEYFSCPHCGEGEYTFSHLEDQRNFGPWRCRLCDYGFMGNLLEDGRINFYDVEPWKGEQVLCLFKFRDIYLVVDSYRKTEDRADWYDYFFHSHQCPGNMLREVVAVYDVEGSDPHGVLRFVSSIPKKDASFSGGIFQGGDSLEALFRTFGTDGQPAPTTWPEENRGVGSYIAYLQREYKKKASPKS